MKFTKSDFAQLFCGSHSFIINQNSVASIEVLAIAFNSNGFLYPCQEPIARSLQLPYIPVTAFSQTDL